MNDIDEIEKRLAKLEKFSLQETQRLEKQIADSQNKIKGLEKDLDILFEIDNAKLARAVCEIQEYLRDKGDFYPINLIKAPTRVGMS
tara:strand:- start:3090 stop:3350 length:261 start_codon:yes stop_codon:yes gene_type:complete